MTIEWVSLSKLLPAGASAAKAIYDRVVGKAPKLNIDATNGGIELHLSNTRDETIIVERIEASPRILGFAEGDQGHRYDPRGCSTIPRSDEH